MIEQSLSNTNETCYSVQIAKIYNLNNAHDIKVPCSYNNMKHCILLNAKRYENKNISIVAQR